MRSKLTYRGAFDNLRRKLELMQCVSRKAQTFEQEQHEEALSVALGAMVAHSGCFDEKDMLYMNMIPRRKKGVLKKARWQKA